MKQMSQKSCLIIVPMKDPALSKSRLGGALRPRQRQFLAVLLYRRTLKVLRQVAARQKGTDVAVITKSPRAGALAKEMGIRVITEESGVNSLSLAVDQAAQWACENAYPAICVIPADLAAPRAQEISRFISVGIEQGQPVICPSTDLGTNAIFVSPPDMIRFCYGKRSALGHRERLEATGKSPILMPLESLRFDIDTQDCLQKAVAQNKDLQYALKVMS